MRTKTTPAPQRAGTETNMSEFVRLLGELATLDPECFVAFGNDMLEQTEATISISRSFANSE